MDEVAARNWVERDFDVPRETMERLDLFVELLRDENERQNLIAASTFETVWNRHIADSAQLLLYRKDQNASWIDLGTGAGFPGVVIAAIHQGKVVLVEERRLRADFLRRVVSAMNLTDKCEVIGDRLERVAGSVTYDVISARAFAPLPKLFALAERFSTETTRWVLPKGRNAQSELEAAQASWQGDFRIEPSLTDPYAGIIIAERVRRRKGKHRG